MSSDWSTRWLTGSPSASATVTLTDCVGFLREAELFFRRRFGGESMTSNEHDALMEFVLDHRGHMEAASVIQQCWPEIKKRVVWKFYDALWEAEGGLH